MPPSPRDQETSDSLPEPGSTSHERNPQALFLRDVQLVNELSARNQNVRYPSSETGLKFTNAELADKARANYNVQELAELETFLNDKGTLDIPVSSGHTITVDGLPREVSIVLATDSGADEGTNGKMSSMLYLRDQVQASDSLRDLYLHDPVAYAEEGETGRTLLMSALNLMSTPAQLARFEHVIEVGDEAGQEDWPHISLELGDLQGEQPNGWRNKQDTFQMLAHSTLDAMEHGFLSADDLSDSHKQFLSSIVPFLEAVGYPKYENSGSWEEVAAHRTSVMAVETALLHKIKTLSESNENLGFLINGSDQATLDTMLNSGLQELGRRLPFESPDHDPNSVKYREADAALTYVLMYGLPKLLADAGIPTGPEGAVMTEYEIENLVLDQLETLIDPDTNGMFRYQGDSYQRENFHTNEVQQIVNSIKLEVKKAAQDAELEQGIPVDVDLETKQALRGERTPQGRQAAWTHSLGQIAGWAAKRKLEEPDPAKADEYRARATRFLNLDLSTVTGNDQWNAALGSDDQYHVRPVTPNRLPECYITYKTSAGEEIVVPSPHTPLNWSSATTKRAVGLLKLATPEVASVEG